jgi:DNA-binding SARP family transcriptional activator
MQDAVCSPGPPPQMSCRIQLLGELRLTFAGQEAPRSLPQKVGGLLGYLACFLHRAHPRDALVDLFWPEGDRESGRTSLRSALPRLRRLFEPLPSGEASASSTLLIIDRLTVRLDPERVTTDVAEFQRDLQAAAQAASPAEEAALLEGAVLRYGGELLPGYHEPWVLAERERLAEAYMMAAMTWERPALPFNGNGMATSVAHGRAPRDLAGLVGASAGGRPSSTPRRCCW